MAEVGEYIYNTFAAALQAVIPMASSAEPEISLADAQYDSSRYTPSVADVLNVKALLFHKLSLPLELVDAVIDSAEYWPRTVTSRTGGEIAIRAGAGRENALILRSYPLGYLPTRDDPTNVTMLQQEYPTIKPEPWAVDEEDIPSGTTEEVKKRWQKESRVRAAGESPCRKIVFTIKSHDQGWGGDREHRGTYEGSYTWFEAGKETINAVRDTSVPLPHLSVFNEKGSSKGNAPPIICALRTISPTTNTTQTDSEPPQRSSHFHHELMPALDCIQRNATATREFKEYKITWSCDDKIDPESLAAKEIDEKGRGRASGTGEYVRNLRIGDAVTVWAKARFQGWVNTIEEVKLEVFWAV